MFRRKRRYSKLGNTIQRIEEGRRRFFNRLDEFKEQNPDGIRPIGRERQEYDWKRGRKDDNGD